MIGGPKHLERKIPDVQSADVTVPIELPVPRALRLPKGKHTQHRLHRPTFLGSFFALAPSNDPRRTLNSSASDKNRTELNRNSQLLRNSIECDNLRAGLITQWLQNHTAKHLEDGTHHKHIRSSERRNIFQPTLNDFGR